MHTRCVHKLSLGRFGTSYRNYLRRSRGGSSVGRATAGFLGARSAAIVRARTLSIQHSFRDRHHRSIGMTSGHDVALHLDLCRSATTTTVTYVTLPVRSK